uniref:Uncharacterized protein n=1 Tax=Syphacia muris TaxID=451379 RepID=A0A0N5AY13_9BILA
MVLPGNEPQTRIDTAAAVENVKSQFMQFEDVTEDTCLLHSTWIRAFLFDSTQPTPTLIPSTPQIISA